MKIAFVGDLNEHTRSFQRLRALRDLGHDIVGVPSVPMGRVSGLRGDDSLTYRISARLGVPYDRTGANRRILCLCRNTPVDLVWIEKGLTIYPWTLASLRRIAPETQVASFSEDDMYAKHNRSWFYTKGLPNYDVVFTTKSYNANPEEIPSLGASRVVFVNKAYDRYVHRPVEVSGEDRRQLGGDIGFVGNWESDREEKLIALARAGLEVRVWGNGWAHLRGRHPRLRVEGRPIYGEDYVRAICAFKVNMCFLRKLNRDLQTDRTMEIPACGAFMLGERTDEHLRLFKEGKEAEFFASEEEMIRKARCYLENEQRRAEIGAAGRTRCVQSGYSHHDRLTMMLLMLPVED